MQQIMLYIGRRGRVRMVVGLPNNSYKPITNTAWVRTRFCKLQKGFTRLAAESDKAYQLLAYGRWFSPGIPASSSTKTCHHDIAEILLKVALNTIKSNQINHYRYEFESRSGEVYSIQHYVIKFVRKVGGFLRVHRFPPPLKLTITI